METPRTKTQTRVLAGFNVLSGQVTYLQRSKVCQDALVSFYAQLRAAYPQAENIIVVLDNWPNHKLPAVLAAVQQQMPPLFLPTYAS